MANFVNVLKEKYPDNSDILEEEIQSLKRKLDLNDDQNKRSKQEYKCDKCKKTFTLKANLL